MSRPIPNPGVMDVPDYVQGASTAPGIKDPIKLSSNENVYGPSPLAVKAIRDSADSVHLYPEGTGSTLVQALGKYWDIPSDRIITTTGSDQLILVILRAFMRPGDDGIFLSDSFAKYKSYITGIGGNPIEVTRNKDAGFDFNLDEMKSALTPKTKIIFLDNPGNPTGVAIPGDKLRALHAILPPETILVLDEAYIEYSDIGRAGLDLAAEHQNVIVFRTFSKAFGLAGMRIGWAFGPKEILAAMNRVRTTFPMTIPSEAAALAALSDRAHVEDSVAAVKRTRQDVVGQLRARGWSIPEPSGNFFLLRFTGTNPMTYEQADQDLIKRGVLVRPNVLKDGERVLRITVGTDAQMKPVLDALLG
ncbi:MAG: histidinol-phosphate transaminase [Alphaproteobacteria bacterium]|nr:histidinol-phosphate transaminase [Alphaproteobacteria bacterium]